MSRLIVPYTVGLMPVPLEKKREKYPGSLNPRPDVKL
jgi:hypothetical protein